MKLIHYVDESGTHDSSGQRPGSEVCVVAGYVAWKDQWETFSREWQAVIDEFAAPLHMGKLVQLWRGRELEKRSPYVGWDRTKAVDFVRALVPIARRHTLFGIGAGVGVRDYESLVPRKLKAEVGHPFHFCFQLLFESLLRDLETDARFKMVSPREPVDWFCDRQDQFGSDAFKNFDVLKRQKDKREVMGAIAFHDKTNFLPLQAADLLAYWSRRSLARYLGFLPADTAEEWEEPLTELVVPTNRTVHWRFHDRQTLTPLVAKFIAERPDLAEPGP